MTSWGARISHTEWAPLDTMIPLPPTARHSAANTMHFVRCTALHSLAQLSPKCADWDTECSRELAYTDAALLAKPGWGLFSTNEDWQSGR